MFELGVTIAVVVISGAALRTWLFARDRPSPQIDGGAVSRSWLAEYRLAKRDSGWP
jgi:hypothetical protein